MPHRMPHAHLGRGGGHFILRIGAIGAAICTPITIIAAPPFLEYKHEYIKKIKFNKDIKGEDSRDAGVGGAIHTQRYTHRWKVSSMGKRTGGGWGKEGGAGGKEGKN